jgi:hemolysin III
MNAMKEVILRQFSNEELVNCITHGVGLALSIAGLFILVDLARIFGGSLQIVSCSIFGSTLVLLYSSSTIYHYFKTSRFDRIFKTIDHSSIYILISGTYTPFALVNLRGSWGWTLLIIVWGLCLIGIVFKIFFVYRFKILSTLIYILMGWIGVIAGNQLLTHIQAGGLLLLLIGGLFYTGGTVFYAWERLPYNHGIWHLFVIAGSTCHYFAVMFYVLLL